MDQNEPTAQTLGTTPVPEPDGTSRTFPLATIVPRDAGFEIRPAAGTQLALRHQVIGNVATITIVSTRVG